jgi:PPOX class probable F420-dependent enzyme
VPALNQLSHDGAALVAAARVARLGTADAAGRPLVVPVCFAFDGERWYSAVDGKPKRATGRPLARVRNIQHNPRVSVLVDHYDDDWRRLRYVIIQGTADLLSSGDEYAYALGLLTAKYPQYAQVPVAPGGGLVIRVTPDAVVEWSGAT